MPINGELFGRCYLNKLPWVGMFFFPIAQMALARTFPLLYLAGIHFGVGVIFSCQGKYTDGVGVDSPEGRQPSNIEMTEKEKTYRALFVFNWLDLSEKSNFEKKKHTWMFLIEFLSKTNYVYVLEKTFIETEYFFIFFYLQHLTIHILILIVFEIIFVFSY